MSDVAVNEPAPVRGGRSCTILVVNDVLNLSQSQSAIDVVHDLVARDEMGYKKYGQNLETNDGRDTAMDAYQELLDAAQYQRKLMEEVNVGPLPVEIMLSYESTIESLIVMREYITARDQ